MLIWIHLIAASVTIVLGTLNLVLVKGTFRHKLTGWLWIVCMLGVTLPSFGIRELNDGDFSWIHGLTLWTMLSISAAIIAVRRGRIRLHAIFMAGTMIGAIVAGFFAMLPGRFISGLIGY